MMDDKNQPEKQFKVGGVCVAVWKTDRTDDNGRKYHTFQMTVDRSYKDSNGNWKHTGSMRLNDIPKLILALLKAYEYLNSPDKDTDEEE